MSGKCRENIHLPKSILVSVVFKACVRALERNSFQSVPHPWKLLSPEQTGNLACVADLQRKLHFIN